jgi:arylsulfatase A-like enzyme
MAWALFGRASAVTRPNIIVYMTEDMSPRTGFFGDEVASTPHLDKFAKSAVTLTNVFSVYAVCAPSRSSFTTGRYPFSYGAHNMRSDSFGGRNGSHYLTVPMPDIKAFPEKLRQHGYWTYSGNKCDMQFSHFGCKTAPQSIWSKHGGDDLAFWRQQAKGDKRPFMGQLGDQTTHESKIFNGGLKVPQVLNRSEMIERVPVPPFYEDTQIMRNDIASQYNNIAVMDGHFGTMMDNLVKDNIMNETIVIWMSDHGDGLPRGKRDVFDYGIHVPCVMWIPQQFQPSWWPSAGSKVDRMVSFIDFAPSLLDLGGVDVPTGMPGFSLFGSPDRMRGDHVFGAKDRMDEAYDHVRYVRSKDGFKLIRNYRPDLPAGGRVSYRFGQWGAKELRDDFRNGKLNEVQSRWFLPRHPEEFYDLNNDPLELSNLINSSSPVHVKILRELRTALDAELARVPDLGNVSESVLAEKFWPGGVQPVTTSPSVKLNKDYDTFSLIYSEQGSSLMYSLQGCGQDEEWYVYMSPVPRGSCTSVLAKAQRYGWSVSDTVTSNFTAMEMLLV